MSERASLCAFRHRDTCEAVSDTSFRPDRLPHTGNDHSTGPLVNCPACVQEHYEEALRGCIPWIGGSGRGAAQEALAVACELVGYDPFDWTSHPLVLKSRRDLLGLPDRRKG